MYEQKNPYLAGKTIKELTGKQLLLARAYEQGRIDVLAQGYVKLPSEDRLYQWFYQYFSSQASRRYAQLLIDWLKQ